MALMGSLTPETAVTDAKALTAWLDQQPSVDKKTQDRHDRLLHGRAADHAHGRDGCRSASEPPPRSTAGAW